MQETRMEPRRLRLHWLLLRALSFVAITRMIPGADAADNWSFFCKFGSTNSVLCSTGQGGIDITVTKDHFSLQITDYATGELLLGSSGNASNALGAGQWKGVWLDIYNGYLFRFGAVANWFHATNFISYSTSMSAVSLLFASTAVTSPADFPSVGGNQKPSEEELTWLKARKPEVAAELLRVVSQDQPIPRPEVAISAPIFNVTIIVPPSTLTPREFILRVSLVGDGWDEESLDTLNFTFPIITTGFAIVDNSTISPRSSELPRLPQTERFYGLGQRWGATELRGQQLYSWTEDGAWSFLNMSRRLPKANATYIPIPFILSSRNYAVLADTGYQTQFDLGHDDNQAWTITTEAPSTDLVFFLGSVNQEKSTRSDSLRYPMNLKGLGDAEINEPFVMFNVYRGNTLIPPPWIFGPWKQMGNVVKNMTDLQVASLLLDRKIPISLEISALHFFPTGDQRGRETEIKAENEAYHNMGMRTQCYFNPYVSSNYQPLFDQLIEQQYFLKNSSGLPYLFEYFGDIISRHFFIGSVDFSNPDASSWYQDQMQEALDLLYDTWMYDFAEYTPIDSFSNATDAAGRPFNGRRMHNPYPQLYQQAAYNLSIRVRQQTGVPAAALLQPIGNLADVNTPILQLDPELYSGDMSFYARSGYTMSGKFSLAHWTGDASSDWNAYSGLPAHVEACLSLGISGVPFCASPIGGYVCELYPTLSPELLIRWTQLGALSALMLDETEGSACAATRAQIFSTNSTEFNWRKYAKLRTALFPYLYTLAHYAAISGAPLTRHHVLSFPCDPVAITQRYQYMFGDKLLVAPVINKGQTTQTVYLPLPCNEDHSEWVDVSSFLAYDGFENAQGDGRFRIGFTDIVKGGQSIEVNAGLDTVPVFVRAGSIIPTLDPSVTTLNNATDSRAMSMFQRRYVQHLWVWPNSTNAAWGESWDGSSYQLSPCNAENSQAPRLCLAISDPLQRITLVQIALFSMPTSVVSGSTLLPSVGSYEDLLDVDPAPTSSAWAFDGVQRTLWLLLVDAPMVVISS